MNAPAHPFVWLDSREQRLSDPYGEQAPVLRAHLERVTPVLRWQDAARRAAPWVQAARENPPPFWAMERLLREFPISSSEGLALMRLAEALLRVPDAQTAMALTADQLGRADFESTGGDPVARLASTALGLSSRLLGRLEPGLFSRLGARVVVAAAVRAMQLLGRQFVLGQSMGEAMRRAERMRHQGQRFSYDMLGEGARTDADALRHWASYEQALQTMSGIDTLPCEHRDGISIKLSALHPRYEDAQHRRVMHELLPRLWSLCERAARANVNLTIDAEEVDRLELSVQVLEALLLRLASAHPQWRGLGLAVQAYQSRAGELVQELIAMARRHRMRLMVRLVKGAYWDYEIKRAQELGLAGYAVYTHKPHTDLSYLGCAQLLLAAPDVIYPQFAGHNAGTIAAVLQMAQCMGRSAQAGDFELQRLHGMGEAVFREVLRERVPCRVYAPVGAHRDLLAYLVRRLLENGANSSFVHQMADPAVAMDRLLASPLRVDPAERLRAPLALFNDRRNSAGLDLTVAAQREPLERAWRQVHPPEVACASAEQAPLTVQRAHAAWPAWAAVPVQERAAVLLRAADALQDSLPEFCALLVRQGRKTWPDALAEVREAVDFLRYYAQQAQCLMAPQTLPGPTGEHNLWRLRPRGVWVCISPWNFPLAIFLGQMAAALVTGNAVVAKPAEQTPGVALRAVELLHQAGVPSGVLHMLHGPGQSVGAALVTAAQVAGVVFTGSTEVARHIQRALAAKDGPIVPLIAETGGINAMVVDSSALLEQVCDAVVQSAFRSAGQRCSALRVLMVHEAIADPLIAMIAGAAGELQVGDPSQWATDVGPLIDEPAHGRVSQALRSLDASARLLWPVQGTVEAAHCQSPVAYEISDLSQVRHEIFGPVLQVMRWGPGCALKDEIAVIEAINSLGFGLTLGLQTRIDVRARALADAAQVGNVYVNRNMIGAVVGVQPFGGQGLSGTGPKAGGPHYLPRFCTEQTISTNTSAAGGNVALLSQIDD